MAPREIDLTRQRPHPRNPSRQSRIDRIRGRLDHVETNDPNLAIVVGVIRALVDLLEKEL